MTTLGYIIVNQQLATVSVAQDASRGTAHPNDRRVTFAAPATINEAQDAIWRGPTAVQQAFDLFQPFSLVRTLHPSMFSAVIVQKAQHGCRWYFVLKIG